MRFNEPSEECRKHECECENCGYYKLKHFQRCPKCFSEAFHRYPPKGRNIIKEDKNG